MECFGLVNSLKKMHRYKIAAKSIQYEAVAFRYWKMVILFCHSGLSD